MRRRGALNSVFFLQEDTAKWGRERTSHLITVLGTK